jgi:hypothetical protein
MFHPKHVGLFAGNKILYNNVSSCWNILMLTHDARIHEHKIASCHNGDLDNMQKKRGGEGEKEGVDFEGCTEDVVEHYRS